MYTNIHTYKYYAEYCLCALIPGSNDSFSHRCRHACFFDFAFAVARTTSASACLIAFPFCLNAVTSLRTHAHCACRWATTGEFLAQRHPCCLAIMTACSKRGPYCSGVYCSYACAYVCKYRGSGHRFRLLHTYTHKYRYCFPITALTALTVVSNPPAEARVLVKGFVF
jgi:hypothetical protein